MRTHHPDVDGGAKRDRRRWRAAADHAGVRRPSRPGAAQQPTIRSRTGASAAGGAPTVVPVRKVRSRSVPRRQPPSGSRRCAGKADPGREPRTTATTARRRKTMSDWRRYDSHLIPAFHETFRRALGQGHCAVPGPGGPRGAASPRTVDQPCHRRGPGRCARLDRDDERQTVPSASSILPPGRRHLGAPPRVHRVPGAGRRRRGATRHAPERCLPEGRGPRQGVPLRLTMSRLRPGWKPACRSQACRVRVPARPSGPPRRPPSRAFPGPLPRRLRVRASPSAMSPSTASRCASDTGASSNAAATTARRTSSRAKEAVVPSVRSAASSAAGLNAIQAAVQFKQPDPLGMGRQRDLHREVHPARALRQRPLQHVQAGWW